MTHLLKSFALVVGIGFGAATGQAASSPGEPVRRAVVVGIDRYRAAATLPPVVPLPGRLVPQGGGQRDWFDLDGAVNDAESIKAVLTGRFGFSASQILMLENGQATAEAILGAIQKHLIDEAQAGDISFFYYAGHGSTIRNTRTLEPSGLDQTIVPADAPRGTPDIRDKELARLFRRGLAKGVKLTAVFDSCHSGSMARGQWNQAAKTRQLQPDTGYVEDPPDVDAAGKPVPSPEEEGMLVFSAAQDYQSAAETDTEAGAHGLFTWALIKVLQTVPPNERATRVFQRVRALMQSEGTLQEPVLAGAGRQELSLFGLPPDGANALTAAVERVWDNRVRLQAGAGIGLSEGCELRKMDAERKPAGPRIRVQSVLGLSSSEAAILDSPAEIHEGDLFQVVRWMAPDQAALRVFVPVTPMSLEELSRFAARIDSLRSRFHWVEDPSAESPTHVMSWSGKGWILEQNPPKGDALELGENPSPGALTAALPPDAHLLLLLPAPQKLAAALEIGAGSPNSAIARESSPAKAHYTLYGRYAGSKVEYAWVLPGVTESALAARFIAAQRSRAAPPAMAMPLRSDWVTGAGELTEAAMRLGRIHGWLQLDAPADPARFPYHLTLREKGKDGPLITGGTVPKGWHFELALAADPRQLHEALSSDALSPRRIYVFVINQKGESTLLFPRPEQGNVENRFPLFQGAEPPSVIPLPTADLSIDDPLGIDTYFLLASDEPLPSPEVLEFSGVRRNAGPRAGMDPLARLISRTFQGQRGEAPAVPVNWSLDRLVLRSVGKGEGSAKGR